MFGNNGYSNHNEMTNQELGEINGTSPHKVLHDIVSHFITEDSPRNKHNQAFQITKKENSIYSEGVDSTNDGESKTKINKTVRIGKNGGNTVGSQPTRTLPKRGL